MLSYLLVFPLIVEAQDELKQVTVQLKWFHQFQFAGFYAAEKQGYFAEEGLKVELLEGGPIVNVTEQVVSGQADFGISNSSLLIDYNKGAPVVAISAMFQHSPFIILTRQNERIGNVADLEGLTLMGETHSAELIAYLKLADVDISKITMVDHTGTVASLRNDSGLDIHAATAYLSAEPFLASEIGMPYKVFNPRDIGIDFYGDLLFSSSAYVGRNSDTVNAMRSALLRGWTYALENQLEMVDYIMANYPARKSRSALIFEAQTIEYLMGAKIIDLGYMSLQRWKNIGNVFAKSGLMQENYTLDGFIFETKKVVPFWLSMSLILGGVSLVVACVVAMHILGLNKKLRYKNQQIIQQLDQLNQLNTQLETYSNVDGLTGISNRRYFDQALIQAFNNARRDQSGISLLMIDIDNFKDFNDNYGHLKGDECLKRVATILKSSISRTTDIVARYGGEEFVIVLPFTKKEEAIAIAHKVCNSVYEADIPHVKSEFKRVTLSVGVAYCIPVKDSFPDELIALADEALYRAKFEGKNTVA